MKKYLIIGFKGDWGKGDTLYEAAKNANCYDFTEAYIYTYDTDFVESLTVTDGGGMTIQLNDVGIMVKDTHDVEYQSFYSKIYAAIKYMKSKKEVHMKTLTL